jgi:Fic family protein
MIRASGTYSLSTTLGEAVEHWDLLAEPLLYLSGYLKKHQAEYYRRLSIIRTEGDWESWVSFFWKE